MFFLFKLIDGVGLLFAIPLLGFQFYCSFYFLLGTDPGFNVCKICADIAVGYFPIAWPPTFLVGTNEDSWATVFITNFLGYFFFSNNFLASSSRPYVNLSLLKVVILLAVNFQLASGSFDLQIYFSFLYCSFFLSNGSGICSGFFINSFYTLLIVFVVTFFGWVQTLPFPSNFLFFYTPCFYSTYSYVDLANVL